MEPVEPCRARDERDESQADIQPDSALEMEETPSRKTAAKVMDEETKRQKVSDDTQLGQDHTASSAQQRTTDTVEKQYPWPCDGVTGTRPISGLHKRPSVTRQSANRAVCR